MDGPTSKSPAVNHVQSVDVCERSSGGSSRSQERGESRDEGDEDRRRRDVAGELPWDPRPEQRDQHGRCEGENRQIQAAFMSPAEVVSLSMSSSTLLRWRATMSPRPTTTSEAATGHHGKREGSCPSVCPRCRATDEGGSHRVEHDLERKQDDRQAARRSRTPIEPIVKRNAEKDDVPGDVGAHHRAAATPSSRPRCRGSRRRRRRRTARST